MKLIKIIKKLWGFQNEETAQLSMILFAIYYNFIRPHQALNGKTPAEVAGLDLELDENKWKSLIEKAVEFQVKNSS